MQLVDGFVALPADATTIEAFGWLADEVIEAGGEAWTWRAQPGSKREQAALRERVSSAVVEEYRALLSEVEELDTAVSRRTVDRLRRDLRAIEARDRFGVRDRDQARAAVERLGSELDARAQETAR